MPKISLKKEEKISEQVVNFLFSSFPSVIFTSKIAEEIARDEEYVKKILLSLEKKGLVTRVDKNPEGYEYIRRIRWRISSKAYDAMKDISNNL